MPSPDRRQLERELPQDIFLRNLTGRPTILDGMRMTGEEKRLAVCHQFQLTRGTAKITRLFVDGVEVELSSSPLVTRDLLRATVRTMDLG